MKIANFTNRLVKAGRIKSADEIKMLELGRSQTKKSEKDQLVMQTARGIFDRLPKAIKSIYR